MVELQISPQIMLQELVMFENVKLWWSELEACEGKKNEG